MMELLFKNKLHPSYWNLIAGISAVLIIETISLCDYIHSPESEINKVIGDHTNIFPQSDLTKLTGVVLLGSSLPLTLDVITNFCNFQSVSDDCQKLQIGRAFYSISTFLFALQLTFQHENLGLMLWSYRIALNSVLLFFVSTSQSTDGYTPVFLLNMLFIFVSYCHLLNITAITIPMKNAAILIYILFGCFIMSAQRKRRASSSSLYIYLFYIKFGFGIVFRVIFRVVIHFYDSDCLGKSFWDSYPAISICDFVLIATILAVIPTMIARNEVLTSKDENIALQDQTIVLQNQNIALKDQVISTKTAYDRYMSHELLTPLNAATMGVDYCIVQIPENTADSRLIKIRETLTEVSFACDEGRGILNDFLSYDVLQNGLLSLNAKDLPVRYFISKCLNVFKVKIRASKMKLRLKNGSQILSNETHNYSSNSNLVEFKQISSPTPSSCNGSEDYIRDDDVLFADKSKLRQILRNLMSIAIKFTPENGIITVSMKYENIDAITMTDRLESSNPNNKTELRKVQNVSFDEVKNDDISHQSGMLVIEIQDIETDILPSLFIEIVPITPGQQLQAGGDIRLGLWISKKFIEMHGGRLSVYSSGFANKSSSFRIEIPMTRNRRKRKCSFMELIGKGSDLGITRSFSDEKLSDSCFTSDATREDIEQVNNLVDIKSMSQTTYTIPFSYGPMARKSVEHRFEAAINDLKANPRTTNKKKKLLIVDDAATNRKLLRKLLESKDKELQCDEAEDGEIAVKRFRDAAIANDGYDAIFMDFVMPNMNGPDATRAIRQLGYKGPIIGVTGNSVAADKQHFIDSGATVVLIKPFKITMLKGILEL